MSDIYADNSIYTDVERTIQMLLQDAMTALGQNYLVNNNQVTKKDFKDHHGAISIMRISDVYSPENGGGVKAVLRTPNYAQDSTQAGFGSSGFGTDPYGQGAISNFSVTDWPDPYTLVYALTVAGETWKDSNGIWHTGLTIVRSLDSMIRSVFRPRHPVKLWDSNLSGGEGGWSTNYIEFGYAGYINRDVPDEEMYSRVTNLRFQAYSYNTPTVTEPVISTVPTLNLD